MHATWAVPGSGSLNRVINYSLCGVPIARWFLLVDAATPGLHPRYLWSTRFLRWAGWTTGLRLPRPKYVDPREPLPIVRWMDEVLRSGKIPHLHAYASCVTRICQAASDTGISLRGAQFAMGGEPTTTARLALVQRVGAEASIHYSTSESGGLGRGCMAREAPDEVHFRHNRCAVIQPGEHSTPDLPHDALLISSVQQQARLILLNVSMGDHAVMTKRSCGCPLERLGLTTHLHTIRSFEKVTAGGVTFLHSDIIRVLEEVLPERFGGGPTDYQLLDEETNDGAPRTRLLVHPRLGPLKADEVRQQFLESIGKGSGVERIMMLIWRDAGLPIVEREAPRITGGGKILHVHLARREIGASALAREQPASTASSSAPPTFAS